jgi:antitoxin ParD1/3/4
LRDELRAGQRDHVERLAAIRARIRRSLDDPRPDLDSDEVDRRLEALFASTKKSAP